MEKRENGRLAKGRKWFLLWALLAGTAVWFGAGFLAGWLLHHAGIGIDLWETASFCGLVPGFCGGVLKMVRRGPQEEGRAPRPRYFGKTC